MLAIGLFGLVLFGVCFFEDCLYQMEEIFNSLYAQQNCILSNTFAVPYLLKWQYFLLFFVCLCFLCFLFFVFFFGLFALSRAAPMAHGGSQARGPIRTAAAGLCQSHSNVGSEQHLWPIPQLQERQILNPLSKARDRTATPWFLVRFTNHWATTGTPLLFFQCCIYTDLFSCKINLAFLESIPLNHDLLLSFTNLLDLIC